jgi:iron complex transport system permease protein
LIHKKTAAAFFFLTAAALLFIIISLGIGDVYISPLDTAMTILGAGDDFNSLIIMEFRMPRILIAFGAGCALALSGAIVQGVIRNPLASPDMIGITGGAGVAAVAFFTIFSNSSNALTVSIMYLPFFAFGGAALAAMFLYVLAYKKGVSPIRLVLVGIGLMALFQALTTLMILMGPIYTASQATVWLTGSVNGTSWSDVTSFFPWLLLSVLAMILFTRRLNMQELGEELAVSSGQPLQRDRFILLLISTALAGSAAAFAGAIGFVGLVAPHIARRITGSSHENLLPVAGMIGGIITVLADLAGRTLFSPLQVPAGVFTAAVGAPYFIYLLIKQHR